MFSQCYTPLIQFREHYLKFVHLYKLCFYFWNVNKFYKIISHLKNAQQNLLIVRQSLHCDEASLCTFDIDISQCDVFFFRKSTKNSPKLKWGIRTRWVRFTLHYLLTTQRLMWSLEQHCPQCFKSKNSKVMEAVEDRNIESNDRCCRRINIFESLIQQTRKKEIVSSRSQTPPPLWQYCFWFRASCYFPAFACLTVARTRQN